MLGAVKGAVSIDFMAAGFALALIALLKDFGLRELLVKTWRENRKALLGAAMIFVFGIGIYLKISGICGRYSMPAVWGLDILICILIGMLFEAGTAPWKRAAVVALGVGLAAVAVSNLGRQNKFAARASLLWQVVHAAETAPLDHAGVAWISSRKLDIEEGIHVAWHLRERSDSHAEIRLFNIAGAAQNRRELPPAKQPAAYAVTDGGEAVPLPGKWMRVREFTQPYWFGARYFSCVLWEKTSW